VLGQPGFPNQQNVPLQPKAVTLSRSDLISFGSSGGSAPSSGGSAPQPPA